MLPHRPLVLPEVDPTSVFELFRGNYGTELITAAVAHLHVFEHLAAGPLTLDEFRRDVNLAERPATVLLTALRAFGLLIQDESDRISLTELARDYLTPEAHFDVSAYISLMAGSAGVLEMVERLRTNRPANSGPDESGAMFIYKEGIESAMEAEGSARALTLGLAGRARIVAPYLAEVCPLDDARVLLDVAGGTGIYSIAWLLRHPELRAIVWDRPAVVDIARGLAEEHGVGDRLTTLAGDMFKDAVPEGADVILFSNVLHDWDVADCWSLISRAAAALRPGGRILIHDVFLNDALDGPIPQACYSAALFTQTEGRLYSAAEVRTWLDAAGLVTGAVIPTRIHCGVLAAVKVTD